MMRKSVVVILFFLLIAGTGLAKTFHFDYQKTVDVAEEVELKIVNSSGDVIVEGTSTDGQIIISATKHVRAADQAEAEEVADHIEIHVNKSGDKIEIETRYIKMKNASGSFLDKLLGTGGDSFGSVDYKIQVPINTEVFIENNSGAMTLLTLEKTAHLIGSSGDIKVASLTGDLFIETASGNIEVSDVEGDADIAATSANMKLVEVSGMIDIRGTSGDITGEFLYGRVNISLTSGKTSITHLSGDARIKSQTGGVTLKQDTGSLEVSTRTGNVEISTELDSSRDFFVETASGKISFMVPETASGTVKLETASGRINTELPLAIKEFTKNKLIGEFGENGPRIYLLTSSGDITLGRY